MANPTLYAGYKVGIYLGPLTSPTTPVFVCGIETTDFTLERGVLEATVRDCSSPLAAPTVTRLPGNKTASLSGSGKIADDSEDELWDWYNGAVARSVEIKISGGPKYAGSFVLTQLQITAAADGNGFADISLTAVSSGEITRTASWT